jgi:hypothetical protein
MDFPASSAAVVRGVLRPAAARRSLRLQTTLAAPRISCPRLEAKVRTPNQITRQIHRKHTVMLLTIVLVLLYGGGGFLRIP